MSKNPKVYVIIKKLPKGKRWKVDTVPYMYKIDLAHVRLGKATAKQYCDFVNKIEGKRTIDFREVEVPVYEKVIKDGYKKV